MSYEYKGPYMEPFEKGVYHVGENNNNSVLSEKQVLEIKTHLKNKSRSRKQLAERYRVSRSTIDMIAQGKRWSHLEV